MTEADDSRLEPLHAIDTDLGQLRLDEAEAHRRLTETQAAVTSQSSTIEILRAERSRRLKEGANQIHALADDGTLAGDELVNTVGTFIAHASDPRALIVFRETKDWKKVLKPGEHICNFDSTGTPTLLRLTEGPDVDDPKPILIPRPEYAEDQRISLQLGYQVTVDNGEHQETLIIDPAHYAVGSEAIASKLNDTVSNITKIHSDKVEIITQTIATLRTLGQAETAHSIQQTWSAKAAAIVEESLLDRMHSYEFMPAMSFLAQHDTDKLAAVYDARSLSWFNRDFTLHIEAVAIFLEAYLRATNPDYMKMDYVDRNVVLAESITASLKRGRELAEAMEGPTASL